eukprot:TRINITY_DN8126_c0_g1_i1.p1 TRINITY_DN8126_c0_g1~~TRINITY_DN8126_c0_g1_i1.p1  ORF type:complete len:816 (+),score=196.89 TRINITY_DN8126_c0_g1_i1:56-2449(+)
MSRAGTLTSHGLSPGALWSALQKYIRRGDVDKAMWCAVELDGDVGLVGRRLRIITAEDVGPSGSGALPVIDGLIREYERAPRKSELSYQALWKCVKLLCGLPKARILSDMKTVFFLRPYYGADDSENEYLWAAWKDVRDCYGLGGCAADLAGGMRDCAPDAAFTALSDISFREELYSQRGPMQAAAAECRRLSEERWPHARALSDANAVLSRFAAAVGERQKDRPLFAYHAVANVVFREVIDWAAPEVPSAPADAAAAIERHARGPPIELDSFVLDMHTREGRKRGMGVRDFFTDGSVVFNEDNRLRVPMWREMYGLMKLVIEARRAGRAARMPELQREVRRLMGSTEAPPLPPRVYSARGTAPPEPAAVPEPPEPADVREPATTVRESAPAAVREPARPEPGAGRGRRPKKGRLQWQCAGAASRREPPPPASSVARPAVTATPAAVPPTIPDPAGRGPIDLLLDSLSGRLAGRGGAGTVTVLDHVPAHLGISDAASVAVKVCPQDRGWLRAQFARECSAFARLGGAAGPARYLSGHTRDGRRGVIVMEALAEPHWHPLSLLIKSGRPQPADFVLLLLLGLASEVAAMHSRGVVHRDLKPDNVMVGRVRGEVSVRVVDFGDALVCDGATMEERKGDGDVRGGDPLYLPPEVLRCPPGRIAHAGRPAYRGAACVVDYSRSDVWSVGVQAWQLLTGSFRSPFAEDGTYVAPPAPEPLLSLVRSMLEPVAGRRVKAADLPAAVRAALRQQGAAGMDLQAPAPATVGAATDSPPAAGRPCRNSRGRRGRRAWEAAHTEPCS